MPIFYDILFVKVATPLFLKNFSNLPKPKVTKYVSSEYELSYLIWELYHREPYENIDFPKIFELFCQFWGEGDR